MANITLEFFTPIHLICVFYQWVQPRRVIYEANMHQKPSICFELPEHIIILSVILTYCKLVSQELISLPKEGDCSSIAP